MPHCLIRATTQGYRLIIGQAAEVPLQSNEPLVEPDFLPDPNIPATAKDYQVAYMLADGPSDGWLGAVSKEGHGEREPEHKGRIFNAGVEEDGKFTPGPAWVVFASHEFPWWDVTTPKDFNETYEEI